MAEVNPQTAECAVLLDGADGPVLRFLRGPAGAPRPFAQAVLASLPKRIEGPLTIEVDGLPRLGHLALAAVDLIIAGLAKRGVQVQLVARSEVIRARLERLQRAPAEPQRPLRPPIQWDRPLRMVLDRRNRLLHFAALSYQTVAHLPLALFGRDRGYRAQTLRAFVMIGAQAAPLVGLIALLIGFILALHSGQALKTYGQQSLIAMLVGQSVTKEIGPLLTAILVAGRSGSALSAEIGTMKVTEEVDALSVMGLSAPGWLVAPKLLAMILALPLLAGLADVLGIFGGYIAAAEFFDVSWKSYLETIERSIALRFVWGGLIKAAIFAVLIVLIASYHGFRTRGGPDAVGRSTTSAVVQSIIWIIFADAFFTWIFTRIGW